MVDFDDALEGLPIRVTNHAALRFMERAGGSVERMIEVKNAIENGIIEHGKLVLVEEHPRDGKTKVFEWMGLHFPLIKKIHYDGTPIWLVKTTLLKGIFEEKRGKFG